MYLNQSWQSADELRFSKWFKQIFLSRLKISLKHIAKTVTDQIADISNTSVWVTNKKNPTVNYGYRERTCVLLESRAFESDRYI